MLLGVGQCVYGVGLGGVVFFVVVGVDYGDYCKYGYVGGQVDEGEDVLVVVIWYQGCVQYCQQVGGVGEGKYQGYDLDCKIC